MNAAADRPDSRGVHLGWYLKLLASTAGVAFLGFLVISSFGERLTNPAVAMVTTASRPIGELLSVTALLVRLPIALAAVIAATRIMGWLFARFSQPPVVGELTAGILLGPSVLGALAPGLQAALFPDAVIPPLSLLSQVSVVLFMFIVGIELDTSMLSHAARPALVISHVGTAVPFLAGSALALVLYPSLGGHVSFDVFALFVGVSLSVTAFPVLARILTDFALHRTRIGAVAISAAAVGDVMAWCLLAGVAGLARAQAGAGLMTTALTIVFLGVMLGVLRPLVARLAERPVSTGSAMALAAGLALAVVTSHAIGIHAIFGAFLFGAMIPSHSPAAVAVTGRVQGAVRLLLPAFFAVTGLHTEVTLISGAAAWSTCLAILLVACAGKFGGSYVAARTAGLRGRDALAIGALMNTRGLVELVVLNVGLSLGVISPTLFAMLVLMALVTTATTSPVLWMLGWRPTSHKS
jgi:Kef-type K+ transport system membrane component KefB